MSTAPATPPRQPHEWWRGAVIYQIYPRSFLDTNGDGIGDLPGCTQKLDYISSLGVDGIWLSPFFKSPMRDFGYDVADYRDVDPLFGTLDDFDTFLREAHDRSLKVIIDQVYSHTSDQHDWFAESRQDRNNDKADWYVWADPKPDGAPPSNWQSVFGGSAWTWDSRRRQYYLHNFLDSQPDLNLHNPDVQAALLSVAQFWFDRGVDGFRLDAINFAMHDPGLRDNPPAIFHRHPPTRPFDFQEHRYNQSHPDIVKFLEKVGVLACSYERDLFTVAEVVGPNPLQEMKAFTTGKNTLSSAYNFDYLYANEITPRHVRNASQDWTDERDDSWPSWAFSNHDAPRVASRWAEPDNDTNVAELFLLLEMSLRGNVFLYQGEELGLPQAEVPFDKLQDPEAIANWPETLGRDGARTPMPWNSDIPGAGFSTAPPWLPVDARHLPLAADLQDKDPTSTLNFLRKLIEFRKRSSCLKHGDLVFVTTPDDVLAFYRSIGADALLCAFNLGQEQSSWRLPEQKGWSIEIAAGASQPSISDTIATLPALSGFIASMNP